MQPEVIRCATWSLFKADALQKLFGRDPFVRGVFLFRGQRAATWPLKTSFDRWFDRLNMSEGARVPVAEKLINEFQEQGRELHFDSQLQRTQIVALAQHYGLPTRLLDWTESPYVAAFFAFADALEKPERGSAVAVHALDTRSYAWNGRGAALVRVQPMGNFRLRNQDGRFTLLESAATCLEEHIDMLRAEGPWPMYRFEIPATEAPQALAELDVMGANAARLFPDLQGCCLTAKLNILLHHAESRQQMHIGA
jgi:hypothetical protein